jgi:hypothetical protein
MDRCTIDLVEETISCSTVVPLELLLLLLLLLLPVEYACGFFLCRSFDKECT